MKEKNIMKNYKCKDNFLESGYYTYFDIEEYKYHIYCNICNLELISIINVKKILNNTRKIWKVK